MTSATTGPSPAPPDNPDQEARPTGSRHKVYVDGPGGVRVPFVEVPLSDSPARNGASPNPAGAAVRHLGTRLGADRGPAPAAGAVDRRPR